MDTLVGLGYYSGRDVWEQKPILIFNTDGTGYTNLHTFLSGEGAYPRANLTVSGTRLYGATASLLVNGQFTVTNPIAGTQQFFRLSQ